LKYYRQFQYAEDETLVKEIIAAAGGAVDGINLDVDTFALALTRDVQLYDIEKETSRATNMDAVFRSNAAGDGLAVSTKVTLENVNKHESLEMVLERDGLTQRNMIQSIDITAELYRSRALIILFWSTVVITIFTR